MTVDAHAHVGGHFGPRLLGDLAAAAARLGVSRVLVSTLGRTGFVEFPTVDDIVSANQQTAAAVAADPVFAGMVYCSGEHTRTSLEAMRRYIADGPFVGVKLWIARTASDPGCDAIYEYAAELGVPVLQHAWWKSVGQFEHESTPSHVAEAARRHPGTTIQMAHLYGAGERGVDDIAPLSNVVIDTSGSDAESGLLAYAVRVLGAQRVVYGSDAPGRDMAVQLAKVTAADLTLQDRDLVLRGNALRLYPRLAQDGSAGQASAVLGQSPEGSVSQGPGETRAAAVALSSAVDGAASVSSELALPREGSASLSVELGGEGPPRSAVLGVGGVVPFVDCSAFAGAWPFRQLGRTDAAALEKQLRRVGATRALVSPLAAAFQPSPAAANEELAAEVAGSGFFDLVPVLNPARQGLAELNRWVSGQVPVRAIRLLPGAHAYGLAAAHELVAAAADRGVAVIVQMKLRDARLSHPSFLVPEPAVGEILSLVRSHPTARIVVAAASLPQIRSLLSEGDRLWCETSHAESQDPLRQLVADVGADRLLCGTHAPILVPEAMAARLTDCSLPAEQLDQIARHNAETILGI